MQKRTFDFICAILASLLAGLMVFGGVSVLVGKELSAIEVTKLFSGKTVEGVDLAQGKFKPYKAYFNSNGNIQAEYWYGNKQLKWRKRNGKWWINDKGRLCIKWEDIEDTDEKKCMVIAKEGRAFRQYKIRKNGSRKHLATFRKFTDGNPDAL